jgi:phage shock protein B
MDFDITAVLVVPTILIGLPWLILHYITKWKTAPTLTSNDEALLDELYQLSRRLDDRMETVERLVAADHPDFRTQRQLADGTPEARPLDELNPADLHKLRSRR